MADGENETRVEYRQTPAQVSAARVLQTKGIGDKDYERLRNAIEEEEWKIRPRYSWVCKLGLGKVTAFVLIVPAVIFWGGPSAFIGGEMATMFPFKGPAVIRAMLAQAALKIVVIMILVGLRVYIFPAGVFRIDEEERIQDKREKLQNRVLVIFLLGIATMLLQLAANFLGEACNAASMDTKMDTEGILIQYIKQTNLCRILEFTYVAH